MQATVILKLPDTAATPLLLPFDCVVGPNEPSVLIATLQPPHFDIRATRNLANAN